MRQRGIRLNIGRLPKRISMVAVMAVSTIFMMPSSVSELATLAGNFFRFSSSEFKPLNVSNANLLTALFGFSVVLGVDTIADKLMIRYRPHVESEQSVRSHVISLVIASIMLIISIALAAGTWEKFIYLRY